MLMVGVDNKLKMLHTKNSYTHTTYSLCQLIVKPLNSNKEYSSRNKLYLLYHNILGMYDIIFFSGIH